MFDFSDMRNDPDVHFPEGYETNYMIPEILLYGGAFTFVIFLLPCLNNLQNGEDKQRVSFIAQNMIIDNNGISGNFGATGILPIKDGEASGWRFSVDQFSLALEANRLTGANFSGMIGLPVADTANIGYDALITADNEYLLRVKSLGKTKFDVFHAEAELLPNSYVELKVIDKKFRPEAMLHGSLNLAAKMGSSTDENGKKIAEFKGIEFRSLHLKTEAPRFTAEYFGYKGS